jgi:hypothetical protein
LRIRTKMFHVKHFGTIDGRENPTFATRAVYLWAGALTAPRHRAALPKGSRAIVSICADGGLGTVALLEH